MGTQSIGSTTGPKADKLGPHSKVTPTNRTGDSNADDAPWITAPTRLGAMGAMTDRDLAIASLLTLRVVARLLQETLVLNQGFSAVPDDLDSLINDELTAMGTDALS